MLSTATECSSCQAQIPSSRCTAGGVFPAAAAGIPAAGLCHWRCSSSASCPVIRFDPAKRQWTLKFHDVRRDYDEDRRVCLGLLQGRIVIIYTKRSFYRHINR